MVGRPREFDRDAALGKAMRLFWEQGYEATGIAQLGDEMGIGRQSLYAAFGDKRTLFVEALDYYTQQQMDPMIGTLTKPGSGVANILEVLDCWTHNASDKNSCGCFLANSTAELGFRDPDMAKVLRRKLERLEKGFHTALKRAKDDGEISADTDTRALARMLVSTGQGLSITGKVVSKEYARDVLNAARRLLV